MRWLTSLRSVIVPCTVILLSVGLLSSTAEDTTMSAEMDQLARAISKFSSKFCYEILQQNSVVSSPLSAELLLALLTLGTSGKAHDELLQALSLPSDDFIRSTFTSVSDRLRSVKGVTLSSANKIYVMEGNYELQAKFNTDAVKVFDAGIEKLNFADATLSANIINKWVESKTNERIKDLLSPDSLSSDTRLVLVNALYFKGSWKKKFDVAATRDLPFYVSADRKVDLPTMCMKHDFRYGESPELDAKLLEMPYEGDEARLLVILPNKVDGLSEVVKKLAADVDLLDVVKMMRSAKVDVQLPKFKIETELDLNVVLPKLGIKAIFNADDSGLTKLLTNKEPLYVSKAVQKAFIEVNEEGAEAAAATAFGVMMCSAMMDPMPDPEFHADHPFIATIVVGRTPVFWTLYMGKQ